MLLHPEHKEATLLDSDSARIVAAKREMVVSLIRARTTSGDPLIWAAVHTLVSSSIVPLMRVGFLPVILNQSPSVPQSDITLQINRVYVDSWIKNQLQFGAMKGFLPLH